MKGLKVSVRHLIQSEYDDVKGLNFATQDDPDSGGDSSGPPSIYCSGTASKSVARQSRHWDYATQVGDM